MTTTNSDTLDIVPRSGVLVQLDQLRRNLDRVFSLSELQDGIAKTDAYKAYATAKDAKDEADKAVAARIWIERRAGLIAKEEYGTARKTAQIEGLNAIVANRWFVLARTDENVLEQIIEELISSDHLSPSAVENRIGFTLTPTTHPSISKSADGRFRITYKVHGGTRTYALPIGNTFTDAKGSLARAKRAERKGTQKLTPRKLDSDYVQLRKLVAHLDEVRSEIPSDAAKKVTEAMDALYKAEDLIAEALKLQ